MCRDDGATAAADRKETRQDAAGMIVAATGSTAPAPLDPDDLETQRAAASFGFSPADLRHLVQLTADDAHQPLLITERRGWTEPGVRAILDNLPASAEKTFLTALLHLFTKKKETAHPTTTKCIDK
ncbi:hypothetical protein LPJ75_000282 [Coemansia sp. RSA 2598]|nr:hypothetical protein LPJ75_000282 [Coemansia sp. RSA 2598]